MIKGIHAMFYSSESDALREFIRDKLKLPHTDVGHGWLIFDLPEGNIGCHPTEHDGSPASGTHDVSFYCDDIVKTVKELRGNGVKFNDEIQDRGYGRVTHFTMPGNVKVELYQPRYEKRTHAQPKPAAARKAPKATASTTRKAPKATASAARKAPKATASAARKAPKATTGARAPRRK